MALPCSGPLSISQIHTAVGSSSYSLRTLSAAAGFSTPDAISEFYCYGPATPHTIYWSNSSNNTGVFADLEIWVNGNPMVSDIAIENTTHNGSFSLSVEDYVEVLSYGDSYGNSIVLSTYATEGVNTIFSQNNSGVSTVLQYHAFTVGSGYNANIFITSYCEIL